MLEKNTERLHELIESPGGHSSLGGVPGDLDRTQIVNLTRVTERFVSELLTLADGGVVDHSSDVTALATAASFAFATSSSTSSSSSSSSSSAPSLAPVTSAAPATVTSSSSSATTGSDRRRQARGASPRLEDSADARTLNYLLSLPVMAPGHTGGGSGASPGGASPRLPDTRPATRSRRTQNT